MNDNIINNLCKSYRLSIVIILIFFIIFINDIDLFNSKITYYIMYIIFILNLFMLKDNPGIVLLYSTLFTILWYKHNLE